MENLLLKKSPLPIFSDIHPEQILPALKQIIATHKVKLNQLLDQPTFTWDNLIAPIEDMDDELSQMWSPVQHLHAVMESDALRAAYNTCMPLLTEYHTEWMQNETLYKAIQSIADSPAYGELNPAERKVIDNNLRDFRRAGVHLLPADKALFAEAQKKLSKLTTQFSENVLDATHAFILHIEKEDVLLGLPKETIELAKQNAEERNLTGWVFTLDYPSYSSIMKYLSNRENRYLMYQAYVTRASDQGPQAGRSDNTLIMEEITKTRTEMAKLLGFNSFAEYSLETRMAKTPERVLEFLEDLVEKSKKEAEKEIKELEEFAKKSDGIDTLEAWDILYYSEKLRENKFALSQEELRVYFPIDKVLEGMFGVVHPLFGITITEQHSVDLWHPHVQFFEIRDENQKIRGGFYTDFYARPHKREGAWMDECRVRRRLEDGSTQVPVAFLTCNFTRPIDDKPALLTHEDVQTLFHEFGHCLHHLLTKVDYAPVSGINGVPWDAVEFPSQFLEFWCFEKEALHLFSAHKDTGKPLPDSLYKKLIKAKNFQSGLQMLRQLEFALFDFRLHLSYDLVKGPQVSAMLDEVRKHVSVMKVPPFNRFQNTFSHIFAGGYAAGYYSYKWAEVLSSDAFSKFEEKGIFDPDTGRSFLTNILEQGGVYDPMDLYIAFRGRAPTIDALLRHSGL